MAIIVILIIVAGCVAYSFLKSTFVRAFAELIAVICSVVIGFNFFEVLANVFLSKMDATTGSVMINWMKPLCFLVLSALTFAIFETIIIQLVKKDAMDFGDIPEKVGRCAFGFLMGLVVAGFVLVFTGMAPIPANYPYERFEKNVKNAESPSKVLLNLDEFVVGMFNLMSKGSFSSGNSFAMVHANFVDKYFLDKLMDKKVIRYTNKPALEIHKKKAVWPAGENIKTTEDADLEAINYERLIVRVGIKKSSMLYAKNFTPSQVRLICKNDLDNSTGAAGSGEAFFPVGYMESNETVKKIGLTETINIDSKSVKGNVKWIDFLFEVPSDYRAVLIQFKDNNCQSLPAKLSVDQAPDVISFTKGGEFIEKTEDTDTETSEEEK